LSDEKFAKLLQAVLGEVPDELLPLDLQGAGPLCCLGPKDRSWRLFSLPPVDTDDDAVPASPNRKGFRTRQTKRGQRPSVTC
jgi:hypothetical protein